MHPTPRLFPTPINHLFLSRLCVAFPRPPLAPAMPPGRFRRHVLGAVLVAALWAQGCQATVSFQVPSITWAVPDNSRSSLVAALPAVTGYVYGTLAYSILPSPGSGNVSCDGVCARRWCRAFDGLALVVFCGPSDPRLPPPRSLPFSQPRSGRQSTRP